MEKSKEIMKQYKSPPARGAWIEIPNFVIFYGRVPSPPARGAWIEIPRQRPAYTRPASPPARGAWIEIVDEKHTAQGHFVAPREGGVD